ncbi:hypothetical protein BD324DRAFT_653049 [Kockovaella imperatae]|uniref:Uncharacterized protein n=1 Tax=Kockovaella imperatae TaxID=4999 RepID=A0A1Y1U9S6_9TREE|nr:hypothetical protein BD324DRAFT_653049 [Kockovaella imperatae]ORX34791.1 hypothetical protein BD324DRAFT_653049 [Kockovaella imperatae]
MSSSTAFDGSSNAVTSSNPNSQCTDGRAKADYADPWDDLNAQVSQETGTDTSGWLLGTPTKPSDTAGEDSQKSESFLDSVRSTKLTVDGVFYPLISAIATGYMIWTFGFRSERPEDLSGET